MEPKGIKFVLYHFALSLTGAVMRAVSCSTVQYSRVPAAVLILNKT